jgi:hypothetical protein
MYCPPSLIPGILYTASIISVSMNICKDGTSGEEKREKEEKWVAKLRKGWVAMVRENKWLSLKREGRINLW